MNRRLEIESRILKEHFPTFRIRDPDDPDRAGVVGTLQTNSGRNYSLWIPLGRFPNEAPEMFIVRPKRLEDFRGRKLAKVENNAEMHLLSPDDHGHPQICHYNDTHWTPNVTLYKVVFKGRLWLEAYENHLRTGDDIDNWLPHM